MGFASPDHSSKDFKFSASSSDEISGVTSFDSSDDEDHGHTFSKLQSLGDMSSLLQQLPIKRGLSRNYEGKSKSHTSLSDAKCLEDLAKPEHPYNRKLKFCKSYAGLYRKSRKSNQRMSNNIIPQSASSKIISKKSSRGSCSSFIKSAANRKNNNTRSI